MIDGVIWLTAREAKDKRIDDGFHSFVSAPGTWFLPGSSLVAGAETRLLGWYVQGGGWSALRRCITVILSRPGTRHVPQY